MGIFLDISPESVIPDEIDLRKESLTYILNCYLSNQENKILPTVIRDYHGLYYIVDGHNTFVVASLFKKAVHSYLPEDWIDFISPDQVDQSLLPYLGKLNDSIEFRFDRCLYEAEKLKEKGVNSISDLKKIFHINSILDILSDMV